MIPYVTITLDKEYKLRFGMRAMVDFERMTGIKLMETADNLESLLSSLDNVAKILYVMIVKETDADKALTSENIIDLIDEHLDDFQTVIQKISEAFAAAFPETKGKNVHPAVKKK